MLITKPWPGPRPYLEADASLFFGRDAEIGIVAEALKTSRLTLLSGARGAGKTSLLRAGVVPRLRDAAADHRGARVIVVVDAWQGDPLQNLIEQIQNRCAEDLPTYDPIRVPRVRPLERVIEHWSMHAELWIILDHFEDYLSAHPNENSEGTLAVELPRIIRRADLRANVLIAMRGEAHAKLGRLAQRLPQLFDYCLRLKLLSLEAARQAIVSPIAIWNRAHPEMPPVAIASALVDAVLRNLAADVESATPAAADAQTLIDPGALQHTLLELWDKRINPDAVRSPTWALRANPNTVAAATVLPVAPASTAGTAPHTRKLATAPMSAKVRPDAGHDRARGRRSFATLAFLFLVTFAVFGAGAWVLQAGRDTQAESVQQAADKALERARETIAKAKARQAERERRIAENENPPAPEPSDAPLTQSGNTQIDIAQIDNPEVATPSPSYVPPPPVKAVGITPPSRHAEPQLAANARDDNKRRAPSPLAPLSRPPKPAATTPAQAPATPAPLTTATASPSVVAPTELTPPLSLTAPSEAAGIVTTPDATATPDALDAPDDAPAAASVPQSEPLPATEADPTQGTTGPESVPASAPYQTTPDASPAAKIAPPSAGRRVAVTDSTRAAARPKVEKKSQPASTRAPAIAAQSSPSGGFITSARALAPSSSAPAPRSRESTELFAEHTGKKAPVHTAAYTIKPGPASPPAIFIHVRDNVQLVHTLRLKRQLEARGVVVSGIRTVSNGPSDADLRYFRNSEREEARRMVNILQSLNVPIEEPKYITGFESSATTRQYELWFPSN